MMKNNDTDFCRFKGTVSEIVTSIEEAKDIIKKLEETLSKHNDGIGLSAIQIGIPKRIFILRSEGQFLHFINPEIVSAEDEIVFYGEGCLSFPSIYLDTKRFCNYIIKYQLLEDDKLREQTVAFYYSNIKSENNDGLLAVAAQHEMDHLSGKILIDYGKKGLFTIKGGKKTGRNDPCPCGKIDARTGKVLKYKKCCLKNN